MARRSRPGLRRNNSFKRYNTIPQQADSWFRSDDGLHSALLSCVADASRIAPRLPDLFVPSFLAFEFFRTVLRLPLREGAPAPPAPTHPDSTSTFETLSFAVGVRGQRDVSVVAVAHETQALFVRFSGVFEAQLEGSFLANVRSSGSSGSTTPEQFMATMQLHAAEEESEGTHFDRWVEVTELDVFIEYCRAFFTFEAYFGRPPVALKDAAHPVSKFLLFVVDDISSEARYQHLRRSVLQPMLIQWSPHSFTNELCPALEAFLAYTNQKRVNKTRLKQLLRWKLVLSTKVLGPGGTMQEIVISEDTFTRYTMLFCDAYGVAVTGCDGSGSSDRDGEEALAGRHTVRGMAHFLLKWADEREARLSPTSTVLGSLSIDNRHVKRAVWELYSALVKAERAMLGSAGGGGGAIPTVSMNLFLAVVEQAFGTWFVCDEATRTKFGETAKSRKEAGNGIANAAMFAYQTSTRLPVLGSDWVDICETDVVPAPVPWKLETATTTLPPSLVTSDADFDNLQAVFSLPGKALLKLRLRIANYLKSEGVTAALGGRGPEYRITTHQQLHAILFELVLLGRGVVSGGLEESVAAACVRERVVCLLQHLRQEVSEVEMTGVQVAVRVVSLLTMFTTQKHQSQLRLRQLGLI